MAIASVSELVEACGDTFVAFHGDEGATASAVASLNAIQPGALLFARAPDADWGAILDQLGQGVVLVQAPMKAIDRAIANGAAIIECGNPRLAFARCIKAHFSPAARPSGIHASAVVEADAVVDPSAWVGPHCYVGHACRIGANSRIFPNVTILDGTRIGDNVSINSGTVIGADGYGYERNAQGGYEKFPHSGGVLIENDVEIGANSCIDRGVLDDTIIRQRAKIDNLVHVAHNCVIGEDAMIIACTMLGGSVKVGARAWVAPAATIINQKSIGADATVGLGAVVTKDVADGQTVMGAPALDQAEFKARTNAIKALLA
jgi:UDP-3-O-[3-hydroxymyristoyl] glucosamine N-acyltransferase